MINPTTPAREGSPRYVALLDEMGLVDEQSAAFGESEPATLGAQDESIAILEGAMRQRRHPLLTTSVVGTFAVLGAGLRTRTRMG